MVCFSLLVLLVTKRLRHLRSIPDLFPPAALRLARKESFHLRSFGQHYSIIIYNLRFGVCKIWSLSFILMLYSFIDFCVFYCEGWNTIEYFELGYLNQDQYTMRMELLLSHFLTYRKCHQEYLSSKCFHGLFKDNKNGTRDVSSNVKFSKLLEGNLWNFRSWGWKTYVRL